jgi:hypothetical protein
MTKFADQLYADLMREHGSTLAHTRPPAPKRHVAARRTLMVASGGSPAYAVTKNPNGTVTLDVYQKSGIAGANAKLHQLGDNVVVVPVQAGCPSIRSLSAPAVPVARGSISIQTGVSKGGSVTGERAGYPGR